MHSNRTPNIDNVISFTRDGKELIGKIIMMIPGDGSRFLVSLLNDKNYIDHNLSRYRVAKKGYAILLREDEWKIYDENADINTPKTIYDEKVIVNSVKEERINDMDEYCGDSSNCDLAVLPRTDAKILSELKRGVAREMIGIATSKLLTFDNPIRVERDEIGEGAKIISWLTKSLSLLGITMDMVTHNGYVHIMREGCGGGDIVSKEILDDRPLHFFEWQIGKPINYTILRNVLFRNNFQKANKKDMAQLDEAKMVLSLEYLIALQPDPKFQLWCAYRIILSWLSDEELLDNVRKMKILVNTYRSRPDIKDNRERGYLPMIVVYPKYGSNSAKTVLKKINYIFTFFKNTAWINSSPTYFIKVDELLYYTNGLSDLKLYVRNVIRESNFSSENLVFDDRYTKVDLAENLFKVLE